MLIGLDNIKTVVDSLQNVPSTLSSILSKVNNLGSQKVLGLVSVEYLNNKTYTGKGLLVILDVNNASISGTVDNVSLSFSHSGDVYLPFSQKVSVNLLGSANRYFLLFTYR